MSAPTELEVCALCGREYDDLTPAEATQMGQGGGCPSEDCPAYWEHQGRVHPDA